MKTLFSVVVSGVPGYGKRRADFRLLPRFAALRFGPGFWAFTFSWAAAATCALDWIALRKPPGSTACAALVLALITAFIGYIAVRTVLLLLRGQLLAPRVPPEKANPLVIPNDGVESPAAHTEQHAVRSSG